MAKLDPIARTIVTEPEPIATEPEAVVEVTVNPDEEPARESNNVLDEVEVEVVSIVGGAGTAEVGAFAGLNAEVVNVGGEDWAVDPETGLITGRL